MPIYEYRCDNCSHELEAFQKLSEDLLTNCPECKTDSLIKRISVAAFRLKGSGWYETDFKSGNKRNVASADSDSSSDSNSGGDGSGSSDAGSSDSKSSDSKSSDSKSSDSKSSKSTSSDSSSSTPSSSAAKSSTSDSKD